ncbi:MAG: hypothetical protein ACLFSQ_12105 [Candidatus Zixiibacteriota bacterium]
MYYSKFNIIILIAAYIVLSISSCAKVSENSYSNEDLGVKFTFPIGWSELSEQEWQDLHLGEDKTLITIMDEDRDASFALIKVPVGAMAEQLKNLEMDMILNQLNGMVEKIHQTGPQRFDNYELKRKGKATFNEYPMAEIVYQGQNPGKDIKWFRILLGVNPNNKTTMIMLIFSAPINEYEEYIDEFEIIEKSWEWKE